MDKPAWMIVQIDRQSNDSFWWGTLESVKDKKVWEISTNITLILIPVKSYSLSDHQFISTKLDTVERKNIVLLIPRTIIRTVIESKTDLGGAFYFANRKT